GPVKVTHPEVTRYFMTIPEAAGLVLQAATQGSGGEIFVLDMGKPVKIVDLAKQLIELSGLEVGEDIELEFVGLRPGEKLFEELLNNTENVVPTYHDKIMIAKVPEYDYLMIKDKVERLIASAQRHYTLETVGLMKELVPEFTSSNATYESIKVAKS
ncbi:MAG: polysaccharide biosynthesis protein, partial [Flavipsychrobacter sp.]